MNKLKFLSCIFFASLFAGCFLWHGSRVNPSNGVFEIKKFNEDCSIVITNDHAVRLYGIKFIGNKEEVLRKLNQKYVGIRLGLVNGNSWLVEKNGELVYETDQEVRCWPYDPYLIIANGKPRKDDNGATFVIGHLTSHPQLNLQELIIKSGIAEFDYSNFKLHPDFVNRIK